MKTLLILSLLAIATCNVTYTLQVGKNYTMSELGNEERYFMFYYSDFNIPSGETLIRMEVQVSTSEDVVGDYQGAFGTTLVGPDSYWVDYNSIYDYIDSKVGTECWEIPQSVSEKINFESFFRVGIWWVNSNYFTIDSVSLITGEYAVEEEEEYIEYAENAFYYNDEGAYLKTGGSCPTFTKVEGGLEGKGWAERYWDCCKPLCSIKENADYGSTYPGRECHVDTMGLIHDHSTRDLCFAGAATTCLSQIPFKVEGCDDVGFITAAVPGNDRVCGKCFLLTFTGLGKYENRMSQSKLVGKKLVVLATNISYDSTGTVWRFLAPGMGVGVFTGCPYVFGLTTDLGDEDGGFISDCMKEIGYEIDDSLIYTKRKECVVKRCKAAFTGQQKALSGCLFMANFMDAAPEPWFTYYQIECPDYVGERY